MYLYPFKIFALSKNKRLLNFASPNQNRGIYDVEKMKLDEALEKQKLLLGDNIECNISVLLGELYTGVSLICLDLDDCFLDTGELETQTKEFLKEFEDYEYEVSTSGTGIHIFILTKLKLETFIVKEMEGCKSFECYTNKRHIVAPWFDFKTTNLKIGIHDEFLVDLYKKAEEARNKVNTEDVKKVFDGEVVRSNIEVYNRVVTGRTPVADMFTLRRCGYKDPELINIIDTVPTTVDQSAHDAKLIRKLLYYCMDYDLAWEMATKTNYYKAKDDKHKKKFNSKEYRDRTNRFLR